MIRMISIALAVALRPLLSSFVVFVTLPMIVTSPAGAASSSKPKEIVVVGSKIPAPRRGTTTVYDVTMKRGVVGVTRNHPDFLWHPHR